MNGLVSVMTTWEIQTAKGPIPLEFNATYGQIAHFHLSKTGIVRA